MIRTDFASLELSATSGWTEILRQINLVLFALLPMLLLFSRGGADAAATIIGLSFLAVVIARRQWSLAAHPLLASLLVIWLLLNLLVSPLAIEPADSFSRSVVWLRFALLFAATTCWLIQSRRDLKLVVAIWGGALAVSIIDGLVQVITGTSLSGNPLYNTTRLTGPLDRPNIGMYVARVGFPLLAATPLLLDPRRHSLRIAAVAIAAAIGFIFILLTGERSAALLSVAALGIGGLGAILIFPRYRLQVLITLFLAVTAGGIIAAMSERIWYRVVQFSAVLKHFSDSHYAELFGIGLDIWRSYPVFGAGMKNFQASCWAISAPVVTDGCPAHPHNVYIEWMAETGTVGLIAYLVFVALVLATARPLLRGGPVARVTGLLIAGCFVILLFPLVPTQSQFSNWPALVFWTSLALTMAVVRLALKERS
ncbi:MAG: O-antigen ligase family protein [Alphaproteobacteria bacterium]|nr:O-antigen ligase family protein [Alphaproteobacteria bacterium]